MTSTQVINVKNDSCEVYVGRRRQDKLHFGNPFSHVKAEGTIHVKSREKAVSDFALWITGEDFKDVEQERREWILNRLNYLYGKKLGCFCAPELCHGDVLKDLANGQSFAYILERYAKEYDMFEEV